MIPPFPVNMILDLTKKCNLSCMMCNVHYKKDVVPRFPTLSDEVFGKLEGVFPHLKKLTLGGNGEPFVDPRIFSRLERIRELNPTVRIETFSNATLLSDPERVESAIRSIDRFMFSINGFERDVYNSIMLGSDFDRLRANLHLFKEKRAASGRTISATAECILMRRNMDTLPDGVDFCLEFGLDELVLKPLWIIDAVTKAEFLRPDVPADRELAREKIRQVRERTEAAGIGLGIYGELCHLYLDDPTPAPAATDAPAGPEPAAPSLPAERLWRRVRRALSGRWRSLRKGCGGRPDWEGLPCTDPWETVQVFEDGIVLLCCQGVTKVGDLNKSSFRDLWFGPEAQAYRNGLLSGRYHGACATCNRVRPADVTSYEKPFD